MSALRSRDLQTRMVSDLDEIDKQRWDDLRPGQFFLSARWLQSVGKTLSPETAFVLVEHRSGNPVAGLAAYGISGETYLMLDPPRLVVSDHLCRGLAAYQTSTDHSLLNDMAKHVGPLLIGRYPVAVCVSPYGFSSGVAGDISSTEALHGLLDTFNTVADEWGARSRAFLYVDEHTQPQLGWALRSAGYHAATLAAHCRLPVTASSLDGYIASLSRPKNARRELRRFRSSGLSVARVGGAEVAHLLFDLAPLYAKHMQKYGHEMDTKAAQADLSWLDERFSDVTTVILIRDGARIVAFSWLFEVGSALYRYISGQTYEQLVRDSAAYFVAGFYEPMQLAIERRITDIHLGTESYEAKIQRGCCVQPVTGFFSFGDELGPEVEAFLKLLDKGQSSRFEAYERASRPRDVLSRCLARSL